MYIYCLQYKKTGLVFYVGRTGRLDDRIQEHKRRFNEIDFVFVVLEECEDYIKQYSKRESFYIKKYISEGHPLVNKWTHGKTIHPNLVWNKLPEKHVYDIKKLKSFILSVKLMKNK